MVEKRCVGNTTEFQGTTMVCVYGRRQAGILNKKHFDKKEMENDRTRGI